jgi:hypothetical protein
MPQHQVSDIEQAWRETEQLAAQSAGMESKAGRTTAHPKTLFLATAHLPNMVRRTHAATRSCTCVFSAFPSHHKTNRFHHKTTLKACPRKVKKGAYMYDLSLYVPQETSRGISDAIGWQTKMKLAHWQRPVLLASAWFICGCQHLEKKRSGWQCKQK